MCPVYARHSRSLHFTSLKRAASTVQRSELVSDAISALPDDDDAAAAAAAVPAPAATTAGTDEDVGKEEEEEAADGDTTFCW